MLCFLTNLNGAYHRSLFHHSPLCFIFCVCGWSFDDSSVNWLGRVASHVVRVYLRPHIIGFTVALQAKLERTGRNGTLHLQVRCNTFVTYWGGHLNISLTSTSSMQSACTNASTHHTPTLPTCKPSPAAFTAPSKYMCCDGFISALPGLIYIYIYIDIYMDNTTTRGCVRHHAKAKI